MSDYVTLMGAEDVRAGGNAAERGGDAMRSAAGTIESALQQHSRSMDQWMYEFRELVERLEAMHKEKTCE